jgi:hypothetical protein
MSELWKKKLLDEQRTHVLKGSTCTVKTIKYYFQQIWTHLMHEKPNDDDDGGEQKSWQDQCRQAFEQAKIHVKINPKRHLSGRRTRTSPKKNVKRTTKKTMSKDGIVQQLSQLITAIGHVKEQVNGNNASQILKMNNHLGQGSDGQLKPSRDRTSNSV